MEKQNTNLPKFGEWGSGENFPYTAVFDKAGKRSVKMHPNKPQQNPDTFSENVSPVQVSPSQMDKKSGAQKGQEAVSSKHACHASREDADLKRLADSPRDAVNINAASDLRLQHHGSVNSSNAPKRAIRQTVGSDRRIQHSPLQPHHQAKVGGKGTPMSTVSSERKGSTERSNNLAPLTPARSQPRSVKRGEETADHGGAVPPFGAWDVTDPQSADGYTHVFNKVREEKLNKTGNFPVAFRKSSSEDQKHRDNKMPKKSCCFPW